MSASDEPSDEAIGCHHGHINCTLCADAAVLRKLHAKIASLQRELEEAKTKLEQEKAIFAVQMDELTARVGKRLESREDRLTARIAELEAALLVPLETLRVGGECDETFLACALCAKEMDEPHTVVECAQLSHAHSTDLVGKLMLADDRIAELEANPFGAAIEALRAAAKLWATPAGELTEQELERRLALSSSLPTHVLGAFGDMADWLASQSPEAPREAEVARPVHPMEGLDAARGHGKGW